ncbi:nuclear transport factor 2 family protein [Marinobacter hydrocarbonoclasticus]|nr:nuclear transport factor 2 family protein [Marinobacter nauticus]
MNSMMLIVSLMWMVPVQPTPDERAMDYFDVYAERQDFARLMSFYADEAVLEDMVYGHYAEGKSEIRSFLDWSRGAFRVVGGGPALSLSSLVSDGNTVVAEGHFRAFEFEGEPLGPWRFVIWLEFDDAGQITRQTDWINYTPRRNYLGGENRNEAVKE